MFKFTTIRCRSCGSVIYNMLEKDIKKLKLVNLICEDCTEHHLLDDDERVINTLEYFNQDFGITMKQTII